MSSERSQKISKGEDKVEALRALQAVLNQELDRLRLKNPQFSMRAFAKKLDISPSALSEILQGKRGISRKAAVKITSKLMLSPDKQEKLIAKFPRKRGLATSVVPTQLHVDQYRLISEWFHFAILSLAETKRFQSKPEWIANRLGVSKSTSTAAIDRLVRLAMLNRDSNGRLETTGQSFSTPDHVADVSLRKAHATNLELARTSLETHSIESRDFTSMTMAIDPKKIPEAKERIRNFQRELCAFLESGEKTEVFKICTQLFPLSAVGETHD